MTIELEVQSLRQVSMFRDIDPAKLKLLAFTSERLSYDKGDVLFHQHEISDFDLCDHRRQGRGLAQRGK